MAVDRTPEAREGSGVGDTHQEWYQALARINEQLSEIRERVARMEARFDELASGRQIALEALNKAEAAIRKAEAAHALASDLHDDRKRLWNAIITNAVAIFFGLVGLVALWKGGTK